MEDTRNSFVFYRSFFESIAELTAEQKGTIFSAICEYALNGNCVELRGVEKAVFILIKPQIDANSKRYKNGTKGGRPPKETKAKPKHNLNGTKPKPNVNVNENDNVNEDVQKVFKNGFSFSGAEFKGSVINLTGEEFGIWFEKFSRVDEKRFRKLIHNRDDWYSKQQYNVHKNWLKDTTTWLIKNMDKAY